MIMVIQITTNARKLRVRLISTFISSPLPPMENKTIKYINNIETTSKYNKTKDKNKESSVIIRGTTIGFFIEYFFNEISYCHFFIPPLPSNTDIRRQNQNQLLPPMMVIYLLRKSFLFISNETRYTSENI